MVEENGAGCSRPVGGPVDEQNAVEETTQIATKREKTMIKVNQKAPDFSAPAYHKGEFTNVKLSDHLGKWVVLCFYPGDFTFV